MLALRPELVDLSRKESESISGPWVGTDFPDKRGRTPSRELGEKIVASQVQCLGGIRQELLAAFDEGAARSAPNMTEAEDVWRSFERLTRKYWVMSKTLEEYRTGPTVTFPGWEALGT